MSPVLDWDPGQNPRAAGTLVFYQEGQDPATGFRVGSDGMVTAPGNDLLQWPTGEACPSDHGLTTWLYNPALCTGGSAAVNQGLFLTKLYVRKPFTSAAVHWSITSAGASPVAGQNQIAVMDPTGARLGVATVDGSISATGGVRTPLVVPITTSFVWVAFLFNAATPPTLARGGSFESTPNINLSAATLQFAKNGAGLTAIPASITPGSNSTTGALNWWAGIE